MLDKPASDRLLEAETGMIASDANTFWLHTAVPPGISPHLTSHPSLDPHLPPITVEGSRLDRGMWERELQMVHGPAAQPVIRQDERHHCLGDWHGTRAETWIMPSMHFEINRFTFLGH